jgi:hypothetical protein
MEWEICWKTWPRGAVGRRAREALRRAPRKRDLRVARRREPGAARARAQQPAHAPGPGSALRQAHVRRQARALGRERALLGAPPRAAVRAAEATMGQGRAPPAPRPVRAAVLPGHLGPVAVVLAWLRGRPEVLSDLALTGRARRAALGAKPAERHARRPAAPPVTALADGPVRRTGRPRGRATGCRRAGRVRPPVRPARPHGATAASGPSAPRGAMASGASVPSGAMASGRTALAGVLGAAGHFGVKAAARAQRERAQGATGRVPRTGLREMGLVGAARWPRAAEPEQPVEATVHGVPSRGRSMRRPGRSTGRGDLQMTGPTDLQMTGLADGRMSGSDAALLSARLADFKPARAGPPRSRSGSTAAEPLLPGRPGTGAHRDP